ncbi:DNA ligase 1 [Bombyx mandarina]|uniref:DNA ligase 1 n=1 Tax=Bombyx mandarina TaxID=7092 RepID=A0A6J2JFK7_BOMMA|nr:DNA ligase 1 [Bombyx mandarina]
MISDESSSDSETGRFKCQKPKDEQSHQREDRYRPTERNRNIENRFNREYVKRREEVSRFDRKIRDKDRHRSTRISPKRRHSKERSPPRRRLDDPHPKEERSPYRSRERYRHDRISRPDSKPRDHRSSSKDRKRSSRSRSHKLNERKRDLKDEIRQAITPKPNKLEKQSRESLSLSPNIKGKRSEVYKAPPTSLKRKSDSPIIVEDNDSDKSTEVQPGSYYSMIPAIIKDKTEESSEIDSSDDEKLRAKLLNLEKKLHKTKKRKHKKRHSKKNSKSPERELDNPTLAEVTSTTDIQNKIQTEEFTHLEEVAIEVTSTQKSTKKESSEEGEIFSEDSQEIVDIDPMDLRHKLLSLKSTTQKMDVCGPALPPHLQDRYSSKKSSEKEKTGIQTSTNMGPSIPDDMRKVLATREVIKYESSDEDSCVGPLPVGSEQKYSDAHKRLEERALDMKLKQIEGHSVTKKVKHREQWMLELPEAKAKYLGLEARSFRAKQGPDMTDRSSWTDNPEDKARKAAGQVKEEDAASALQREAKSRQIETRDKEQEDAVKKHKKKHKREESLLELHQKKLKKKKKKEEKEDDKKERRPFSRDVDLQVNRFDEAQKRSIIKKAQDLNNRFSKGEAKYL